MNAIPANHSQRFLPCAKRKVSPCVLARMRVVNLSSAHLASPIHMPRPLELRSTIPPGSRHATPPSDLGKPALIQYP